MKKKSTRLLLEGVVSVVPVPYYWGWAIISGIIFTSTLAAVFYFDKSLNYIPSFFILSILTVLQPATVIWAHRKMKLLKEYLLDIIELPENDILKWYENQMAIIFNEKRMFASGVIINIIFYILGVDQYGFTFKSSYSYAILEIDYLFTHFFMGFGLYPLLFTAFMVYKITKLPMNMNVLLSKNLQIKGLLYSKLTICAASVYAGWGLFRLSTPAKLTAGNSKIVYFFFALLLMAYLILPQYSIHQVIIKTKKEKLDIFSKRLMAKVEEAFSAPTKDNILCLRNFLDIEQELDEMCVWPFGSYEVLHIVLIVIIPFMVVLLEIIFGIMK